MDFQNSGTSRYSKEMVNENVMSSVRRCAIIYISSLEFIQQFESTADVLVTMSLDNRRNKKMMSKRFFANNGQPFKMDINGEFQLFYSHNVKYHRDPILRIAVENTKAKTFTRHRSIAAALVSLQQVVQHDFDGMLTLYECHVTEKNPIGRLRIKIRSVYVEDQEIGDDDTDDNSDENLNENRENEDNKESSESDNETGFARIGRQVRRMFSNGGILTPHSTPIISSPPEPITEISTACEAPELSKTVEISPCLPPRGYLDAISDDTTLLMSPIRSHDAAYDLGRRPGSVTPTRQRSLYGLYASDGGSQRNSRTSSGEMQIFPGMVHGGAEETRSQEDSSVGNLEKGVKEEKETVKYDIAIQLAEYQKAIESDSYRPFIVVIDPSSINQPLLTYLSLCDQTNIIPWKQYTIAVPSDQCTLFIRLNEHDMESLRVLFLGDDAFCWYLLTAYLLLVSDNPNALYCSVSYPIAMQSLPYVQILLNIHRFIDASNKQTEDEKQNRFLWSYFHIELDLLNLLQNEYACQHVPINEVSIQLQKPIDDFTASELDRLLDSDHGRGMKLKIPFLTSICVDNVMPFSKREYLQLLNVLEKKKQSLTMPDLLSELTSTQTKNKLVNGALDYWPIDGDQKQVNLTSKGLLGNISLQRTVLESSPWSDTETGFLMQVITPLSGLTNKRKRAFNYKYCMTDVGKGIGESDAQNYECSVSKMMLTFDKEGIIFVDGIEFYGVSFMNVSNKYFSKTKSFPVCIPFVESNCL